LFNFVKILVTYRRLILPYARRTFRRAAYDDRA
jgi:hypothetical protein